MPPLKSDFSHYLLDNFPTGIYKTDEDGNFTYYNSSWYQIMGKPELPFTVENWISLIHPADVSTVMEQVQAARKNGTNFDFRYRLIFPSGEEKYIWSNATAVYENGKFKGYFGSLVDETEKYNSQKKYQLSQNQFSELLNTITDIVIIHLHGIIIYVNKGGCDLTEYSREEIIGSTLLKFTHPQHHDTIMESITDPLMRFYHNDLEMTIVSRTGKEYKMIPRSNYVTIGEELAIATLLIDISLRKKEEEALILAKNTAEDLAKAKSDFISVISHEIRTPLNGIVGLSKYLQQDNTNPDHVEIIDSLVTSGSILEGLLNDILDFSKIDSGKMNVNNEAFNPNKFLQSMASLHKNAIQRKGIDFIVESDIDDNTNLVGDQNKLTQIFNNLLSNAIKFTENGFIKIQTSFDDLSSNAPKYFISIEDTGIGIPIEKQKLIFTKFYQVQDYSSRKYTGSGLGLSIVKGLIEILNGEISFTSEEGKGTVFRIALPFEKSIEMAS